MVESGVDIIKYYDTSRKSGVCTWKHMYTTRSGEVLSGYFCTFYMNPKAVPQSAVSELFYSITSMLCAHLFCRLVLQLAVRWSLQYRRHNARHLCQLRKFVTASTTNRQDSDRCGVSQRLLCRILFHFVSYGSAVLALGAKHNTRSHVSGTNIFPNQRTASR